MKLYRKTLEESDRVQCTTRFLAQRIQDVGKEVHVVPNSLNQQQLALAERILASPKIRDDDVHIAYFSGSNTHDVDFRECEKALIRILAGFPEVRFSVIGNLDLGHKWTLFEDRVSQIPFMPYLKMLEYMATVDINLAPLEIGNPYVEGKSHLKIFEAGVVEVPTVASRTESYSEAIQHGEDGFLVGSPDEWYESIHALVSSSDLRRQIGLEARARALVDFSPENLYRACRSSFGLEEELEKDGKENVKPIRITWIVPDPIIGGGGHRNIFRAIYHLESFGHDLCVYITGTGHTEKKLGQIVREHFYPIRCRIRIYHGDVEETDVLIATHWTTVDAVKRNRETSKTLIYFVQDFEPMFAPMSSEYLLAENTYKQGFYHITSGPWCEDLLKKRYGAEVDSFRFPIDKTVYFPRTRTKTNRNIVFFGKPEMPRRCFDLGILALEYFHEMKPEVEIILFGSDNLFAQRLPFPAKILGILPSLVDLANLYSNADIGMVFSTTNPSLIPYEMMACGLPVVDLGIEGNEINYHGSKDTAFLASPEPQEMAREISELIENKDELLIRSKRGLAFAQTFPSEMEMARKIENLIVARYRGLNRRGEYCPICIEQREFSLYEETQDISGDDVEILKCGKCGILMNMGYDRTGNELQKESAREFYCKEKIRREDIKGEVLKHNGIIEYVLRRTGRHPKEMVFLEVGFGRGLLLLSAAGYGFRKVIGLEVQMEPWNNIAEMYQVPENVEVCSEIEQISEKADILTLWHTAEHLSETYRELYWLTKKIKPGGLLFIQVPMYDERYICKTHLCFFDKESLSFIFRKLNLDILEMDIDRQLGFLTGIARRAGNIYVPRS